MIQACVLSALSNKIKQDKCYMIIYICIFVIVIYIVSSFNDGLVIRRLSTVQGIAHFTILLSEISPERLALMPGAEMVASKSTLRSSVDAWVQVACPRLSMDWGSSSYSKPMWLWQLALASPWHRGSRLMKRTWPLAPLGSWECHPQSFERSFSSRQAVAKRSPCRWLWSQVRTGCLA